MDKKDMYQLWKQTKNNEIGYSEFINQIAFEIRENKEIIFNKLLKDLDHEEFESHEDLILIKSIIKKNLN